jgi:flagellar motor switch protein FliM
MPEHMKHNARIERAFASLFASALFAGLIAMIAAHLFAVPISRPAEQARPFPQGDICRDYPSLPQCKSG